MDAQRWADSYQPAFVPSGSELENLTIGIDPTGGGAAEPSQRLQDDLALMTGAYLFHFVQAAGGVPLMTRADDRCPLAGLAGGGLASADLCVTIDFTARQTGQAGVLGFTQQPLARSLARCLAQELHLDEVTEDHPKRAGAPAGAGECAAAVNLPVPEDCSTAADCPTLSRDRAESIFQGIAAFVRENRAAIFEVRGARSTEATETPKRTPVPRFIDRSAHQELEALARRIWPNGTLPIDKAEWFCRMYADVAFSDRTFVYFQPKIEVAGGAVVIGGATNVALLRNTLVDALRIVGIHNTRTEMRLLPEEGRLTGTRYGVCTASTALTFSEPSEASSLRTQLLCGEPVRLLDRDSDYLLVHADDGYWGWVREDCIRELESNEFERFAEGDRTVLLCDLEPQGWRIPRGASLPVVSPQDRQTRLQLPDGTTFDASATDVRIVESAVSVDALLAAALAMLHRPYVFGGVSPVGLDCSGLVKNVLQQAGVSIGRDAAQQFVSGRLVATRWDRHGIRPGDLLYFANECGRIFHVAVALSSTHFVHGAPPGVKLNSLAPGDRLYCPRREATFLAARRL